MKTVESCKPALFWKYLLAQQLSGEYLVKLSEWWKLVVSKAHQVYSTAENWIHLFILFFS
jgi:hypothetical protein